MDTETREEHYAGQNGTSKLTPAQRKRLLKKQRRPVAVLIREQEAKVARLRGAAKKSATKTLDKLKAQMP